MGTLGRTLFLLHLPLTAALIGWAWLGRVAFGVGGWWLMILPIFIGPWVLLALVLTSVLAFTRPQRPRAFTRGESVTLLGLWAGLVGVGFFIVDFGDVPGSEASILTKLVGESAADLSSTLALVSGAVAAVAWLALIVQLILDRQGAPAPQPAEEPVRAAR